MKLCQTANLLLGVPTQLPNPEATRFCSDMRVPNTAILRPVSEALTVEDIKFKLEGATVFSVLDMNEGYHQLELDEDSRHLTTFYGTERKMRYTRLNYGTISSQDIFDKAVDDTIVGLHGVLHIRDDFIVFGKCTQTMMKLSKICCRDSGNMASRLTQRNASSAYPQSISLVLCSQKTESSHHQVKLKP